MIWLFVVYVSVITQNPTLWGWLQILLVYCYILLGQSCCNSDLSSYAQAVNLDYTQCLYTFFLLPSPLSRFAKHGPKIGASVLHDVLMQLLKQGPALD